ncbi:MAG TPA: glycosyltransferase family 39 protein [Rubrobacter sp.]|nr:glycosyltransferase family 39 protein [Rubrobacter sp.]
MSGSKTSEKVPVRAYRRGTPSGGAVRERSPPLRSLLKSRALLVLLAIMLLGAVLRFYGLGFQSLWSDELASWDFSNRETISQSIGGVRSDDHPPLYFLILRFAQWIIGDTEWALRFPSAFAGWLCIPAIYLLGKRLYSEREGIIAALFLAVFWAPIYFSQEVRVYSMLILLSILTSYFWWNIMLSLRYRRELPTREAALYVVCAVLCAYVHYFGLILVVLQGAALAALAYGTLRKAVLLYVPVAVAYLPWLPSMVHQSPYGDQNGTRIGDTTLQVPPDYFQFLFGRSGLLSFAAWTLLAFLLIRGWDDLRRRRKSGVVPPGLLLAAWAVGPFVVAFAASQSMLTNENLLVSLPAVYLLLARSVTRTFSGRAAAVFQGTVAVGLAAVGLAYLIFSMDYYTTPTKEQFREAALYVVGHEDKNTLVVRCDTDDRLDYYLKTRETGQRNDAEACQSSDFPKIENRVKEGDFKEVFHFISHEDPDQQMVSKFQRSFQPVSYERFDGAAVVVYKVRPSAPAGFPQPEPPDVPQPEPPSNLPRQE